MEIYVEHNIRIKIIIFFNKKIHRLVFEGKLSFFWKKLMRKCELSVGNRIKRKD